MAKIKYIFEGPGTKGDGVYRDHTLPEFFPDGELCRGCVNLHNDCSMKQFKDMRPVIGNYLDGTKAVRCKDYKK